MTVRWEMYFCPNTEKECDSLLILMNLIGLLIFVHVFGRQVNGCLFKEIPSQQKLFSLSDSPTQVKESALFHSPSMYRKGSQIKKKRQRKTVKSLEMFSLFWMAAKSIRPSSFQHSSIPCPKQMVRRSVQRFGFVSQAKPNRSDGAIDRYVERGVHFQRCALPVS